MFVPPTCDVGAGVLATLEDSEDPPCAASAAAAHGGFKSMPPLPAHQVRQDRPSAEEAPARPHLRLLRQHSPGTAASAPRLAGVVLVTTRAVRAGEELLFDYGLPPGRGRPAWYHDPVPPPPGEAARGALPAQEEPQAGSSWSGVLSLAWLRCTAAGWLDAVISSWATGTRSESEPSKAATPSRSDSDVTVMKSPPLAPPRSTESSRWTSR